jgi:diguanylate cyclase (GGDEF)-like protein
MHPGRDCCAVIRSMGKHAKYLLQVTGAKVAFLAAFWIATYLLPSPNLVIGSYERITALVCFIIANAAGMFAIGYREARADNYLWSLFAVDTLFALYMTRFFAASEGLLVLLMTIFIIFQTLVVSRIAGGIALLIAMVTTAAVIRENEVDYNFLGDAPGTSVILYVWLLMMVAYGVAYLVITRHKRLMAEGELLATELADSTIGSEIARGELMIRNQQLSTLLLISESLSSSLEVNQLFKNFGQAIRNSVDYDNFSLLVFDPETRSFRVLVSREEYYDLDEARRFPIDKGVAGHVYNRGVTYLTNDARTDPLVAELPEASIGIGSLMCVPLYFQDEILGVLTLEAKVMNKFTDEQLRFVESITPLVAIAVNNVISYQLIKTASTRDKLTKLYNYFAFTQRFYEMLENAFRKQKPITLIIIDIDDFKKVNDTYGHLAGNTVLSQLGDLLTSFFRRSDLVARYGGEEFAIILNGTPLDIGLVIADTLRESVVESVFLGNGQPKLHLSISLGVSSTEDTGIEFIAKPSRRRDDDHFVENLEEIVEKMVATADAALYSSKNAGKNRVTASANSRIEHKNFTEYRGIAPEGALPKVEKKPTKIGKP